MPNDVSVCIGRIVAAPGSPVDQQGLWRVEPQPDERHRGRLGDLFDDAPVGRPRIYRIDDDAVACTEDSAACSAKVEYTRSDTCDEYPSGPRRCNRRNTAQTLPRLVAAQHDRTRDGADRRRKTESQRRLPRARETSDRHETGMRRMQEMFGHREILARHVLELTAAWQSF